MYKVYLSPTTRLGETKQNEHGLNSYIINEIASIIKKALINEGNFVVYTNKEDMTLDEIINNSNDTMPDIHVAINTYIGNKRGIEIYAKVGCELSNGYAKEIYKELLKIYYDKGIDNGVIYDDKIAEIMKIKSPGVLINVGCRENKEDMLWINNNIDNISLAIKKGIVKATKLRPC